MQTWPNLRSTPVTINSEKQHKRTMWVFRWGGLNPKFPRNMHPKKYKRKKVQPQVPKVVYLCQGHCDKRTMDGHPYIRTKGVHPYTRPKEVQPFKRPKDGYPYIRTKEVESQSVSPVSCMDFLSSSDSTMTTHLWPHCQGLKFKQGPGCISGSQRFPGPFEGPVIKVSAK